MDKTSVFHDKRLQADKQRKSSADQAMHWIQRERERLQQETNWKPREIKEGAGALQEQ